MGSNKRAIQERAHYGVSNREWYRRDLIGKICIMLAQLFHRIRDCHSPLHVGPKMSGEVREMRRMVSGRRI